MEVICKKCVLENFAKFIGNTCVRVSFSVKLQAEACNFIKKGTLAHVLLRTAFFIKHMQWLFL